MTLPLFDLTDRVAIVTGGTGVLGGEMARALAAAGVRVGLLGRREEVAQAGGGADRGGGGAGDGPARGCAGRGAACGRARGGAGTVGAAGYSGECGGGNLPGATLTPQNTFFDLESQAFQQVVDLNLVGTVLPSQVFGAPMATQGRGVIVNISSMAAQRAVTRVAGYSAAKAAVDNFTRWLATELARRYGEGLRVNAIAPGFFIGDQNRRLLLNEDGSLTARGQAIVEHTPMGRFGEPEELVGTLIWLCSDAARFVTGVVVPVDGGFSAFTGI